MHSKNQPQLSLANLIVLGRLGRGATSHVFRAQSTQDKKLYAMKVFDKKAKNYNHSALRHELELQISLSHDNVVSLVGHIQDQDNCYVLTEYCEGGELTKRVKEDLSEAELADIAFQIAKGLQYLHSNDIAHCDLKLSNLLLQGTHIKICDFGFSQKISDDSINKLCGTVFYLAPEILKTKKRQMHKEADIWALGICLLILLTKKQPYAGQSFQDIARQAIEGNITTLPDQVSPELNSFMKKILQKDPLKRLTLQQFFKHQFIQKHKNKITEQWSFKRAPKAEAQVNATIQKKSLFKNSSDLETTVKVRKSLKDKISSSTEKQGPPKKVLTPIEARLISPLTQFYYQTKNQGFIKISPAGHLCIQVKGVLFSICNQGKIVIKDQKSFDLDQLNQRQAEQPFKKLFQLYEYASNVIGIFKTKKYSSEKVYKFKGETFLIGMLREKKKVVGLTKTNSRKIVLEYNMLKKEIKYRFENQEWRVFDQTQSEDDQIAETVLFLMGKIM